MPNVRILFLFVRILRTSQPDGTSLGAIPGHMWQFINRFATSFQYLYTPDKCQRHELVNNVLYNQNKCGDRKQGNVTARFYRRKRKTDICFGQEKHTRFDSTVPKKIVLDNCLFNHTNKFNLFKFYLWVVYPFSREIDFVDLHVDTWQQVKFCQDCPCCLFPDTTHSINLSIRERHTYSVNIIYDIRVCFYH